MTTEELLSPTNVASESTSSLKGQLLQNLKANDEYRFAFVEEKIQSGLAAQIRAIRLQREMDQKQFAERLGKKVSWVYRLEDPNQPPPTIPSLLDVARTLDVDLEVRFRPFSSLVDEVATLSPRSLEVPSFAEEIPGIEKLIEAESNFELRKQAEDILSQAIKAIQAAATITRTTDHCRLWLDALRVR